MSNSPSDQDRKRSTRTVVPILLVVIIAFSTSAGCIDKGIADSLVEIVEGDDGPGYVWDYVLEPDSGNFVIEPNDGVDPDIGSIAEKVFDNVSSLDPAQTIANFKVILNEENLSMRTFKFEFPVFERTRNLNIELETTFRTTVGDNAPSAGWFELTIFEPHKSSDTMQFTQFQEKQVYTLPMDPTPGEWRLELQGTGIQSPGNLVYSGEYTISARAEMPKEP